jgi:hypothetical protein
MVVDDARNSANHLFTPVRQEKDHVRMGTERMFWTEFRKLILDERRDPISIPFINVPGKSNEGHEVFRVLCFFNMDCPVCHIVALRQINFDCSSISSTLGFVHGFSNLFQQRTTGYFSISYNHF